MMVEKDHKYLILIIKYHNKIIVTDQELRKVILKVMIMKYYLLLIKLDPILIAMIIV
jgi:hypothetical protein